MPRIILGDKTSHIMRGILTEHQLNGKTLAKMIRKPVSTMNHQIQNAERMTIEDFRQVADAAFFSDAEILRIVRG